MRMTSKPHLAILATLTILFGCRVAGQAVQHWFPQPWLPDFGSFQGSSLQYSTLLVIQLLILGLMLRTCWRLARGLIRPDRRLGRGLLWFGAIYMAGSVLRIGIGLTVAAAPAWFSSWIPAFFHLVLAGFVLVSADMHLRSRLPGTAE